MTNAALCAPPARDGEGRSPRGARRAPRQRGAVCAGDTDTTHLSPLPAKGPPRVPKVLRSAPPWCPLLSSRTYGRAPVPSAVAGKGQEPRAEPPRVAPGAGIPQQTPSCPPSTPGRTALQDICCIHMRARPYKSPIHAEENPTCCLGSGCPSCRLLPAPGREGRRRLEAEKEPRSYKRVCGRSWTLGCPVRMGRKKWRGTHGSKQIKQL